MSMRFKAKAYYNQSLADSGKGNIILAPNVLNRINRQGKFGRVIAFHCMIGDKTMTCGVQEYTAKRGTVQVPFDVTDGCQIELELVQALGQATSIRFGISQAFDQIENKLNPIFHAFSGRTVLNEGDVIKFGEHEFNVLECEPSPCLVTDCDANLSFIIRQEGEEKVDIFGDEAQVHKEELFHQVVVLDGEQVVTISAGSEGGYTFVDGPKTFAVEGRRKIVLKPGTYQIFHFGQDPCELDISETLGECCSLCESYVHSSILLHQVRCARIYSKCDICHEPYRKGEKHLHCVICGIAHKDLTSHMRNIHPPCICGENDFMHQCSWKCNFCLLSHHPSEHTVCGSKTDQCPICKKYVPRIDLDDHVKSCLP